MLFLSIYMPNLWNCNVRHSFMPVRSENKCIQLGFMFPSLPIGADKYLWLMQSHLSREWMQIVTFPTEDKYQMFMGLMGF